MRSFLRCQSLKIKPQKETYTQQEYIGYVKMRLKSKGLESLAYSIPNEGKRDVKNASRMIAEGLTKGIPDTFIAIPKGIYHGLYIEFKRSEKEKPSPEQTEIIGLLRDYGYFVQVCWNSRTACELFEKYLALKNGESII
jgi:hypothetical protein